MKKNILFFVILITAICATAYASSMWEDEDDNVGTDSQEGGEVALEKLYILFFPGSGQSSGGGYLISGKVSYPDDKTLKIKALEASSAEPVGLLHMKSEQYCQNTSEFILNASMELCDEVKKDLEEFCSDIGYKTLSDKYCLNGNPDYPKISEYDGLYDTTCKIDSLLSGNNYICVGSLGNSYINYCVKPQYNGEQSFSCSLSTAANPALSENSKIKLQFFVEDKAIAETEPFEIKGALDGKVAFENGLKTLTYLILEDIKGEDAKLEDAPIEHKDSDGDGQNDIVDDFPSLSNNSGDSPVKIDMGAGGGGAGNENGGCDCNLNPAAGVNGLGWLVNVFILGIPAAIFGFRRK